MSGEAGKYVPPGKGAKSSKVERVGGEVAKIVDKLNADHAFVLAGADAVVLKEGVDAWGEPEVRFVKIGAFKLLHGTHFIDTGKREPQTWAEVWLESPLRREYLGVCLAPDGAPENYYNLWRGFAVEPREGDVSLWKKHVYDVLADGNEAAGNYIMAWFADIAQNPGRKCETSLVVRGEEGSGKTLPGKIVGSLFPAHYSLIDDPRYVTGKFNRHMETCILLQADEGFWAGDKQAEGRLKGIVTSDVHYIEKKGVDAYRVRNLIRLMVTSNNEWVIPAGYRSRRWSVFDASSRYAGESSYFQALADWGRSEEGRAALLHYLLNFDMTEVDLKRIPDTEALYEQRISTMTDEDAWWLTRLKAGTLLPSHDTWVTKVPTEAVWESYAKFADKIGVKRKRVETQLAIALRRRLLPQAIPGERPWPRSTKEYVNHTDDQGMVVSRRLPHYEFPPLDECRRHFQEMMSGHAIDWGDDGPT
jgi:hypothetical protein